MFLIKNFKNLKNLKIQPSPGWLAGWAGYCWALWLFF